jgi:hypothetical protein
MPSYHDPPTATRTPLVRSIALVKMYGSDVLLGGTWSGPWSGPWSAKSLHHKHTAGSMHDRGAAHNHTVPHNFATHLRELHLPDLWLDSALAAWASCVRSSGMH